MGKSSRRNRARAHRADPLGSGRKPVKPPTDPELASLREAKVLPVMRDLQSTDLKARAAAAGAVANIVHDVRCRKLLLREHIVHVVMTGTLTDAAPESRAAGWHILHVLAHEEDPDFCVHLYRVDVLTALEHATRTITAILTSVQSGVAKLTKAEQRVTWGMAGSLVSLLGLLVIARDEILDAVTANHTIVHFLFRLAVLDSTPQPTLHEALSCLMTLAEDNLPLCQALVGEVDTRVYSRLLRLQAGSDMRAVLTCGILHNVFSSLAWLDHSPGVNGACDAVLVPSLSQIVQSALSGRRRACPQPQDEKALEVVQLALEILASISTDVKSTLKKTRRSRRDEQEERNGFGDHDRNGDDSMDVDEAGEAEDDIQTNEPEGEESDGESDDEDGDLNMEADMEHVTSEGDPNANVGNAGKLDDLPTLRELIQKAVPQLIRLSNADALALPVDSSMLSLVSTVKTRALSALNNLAWTMACVDFSKGRNAPIFSAWSPAAKRIWMKTVTPILDADSADLALATAVTGLAWALAAALGGTTPLRGDEHGRFISLYKAAKESSAPAAAPMGAGKDKKEEGTGEDIPGNDDPLQGLGVKCVGVLGSLARDPAPVEVNREIGVFLITVVGSVGGRGSGQTPSPPADVVEALDQLLDIYADEAHACDKEVFWKHGFLQHLEAAVPKLKAMIKTIEKRQQGELRHRADEVMLNLTRFVRYKKKHPPKEQA